MSAAVDELIEAAEACDRVEQQIERGLVVAERLAALLERAVERDDATLRKVLEIVVGAHLGEGTLGDALGAFRRAAALLELPPPRPRLVVVPADTAPGLER